MTKDKKTAAYYTLGCKVNTYDTQAIMEKMEAEGFETVGFDEHADVYIINTCTVTSLGDKKSRQLLRRARRKNPDALIVAAGCYAQTAPNEVLAVDEVDLVVGTGDRKHIVELIEKNLQQGKEKRAYAAPLDYSSFDEEMQISRTQGHTRGFVKIQEGCTQYCSYCIVPYARGPVRSRKKENALKEIGRLAENDYKEIVLTGIHVSSYGRDFKNGKTTKENNDNLLELVKEASKIPGISRIRFSSLEPRLMTDAFLKELSQIPQVCPHFHLSLQSGAKKTLKRMNRHYTPDEYEEIVRRIRSYYPDAAITTDVIVGFPGESEEDFEESLEFVQRIGFSRIHIFKYSPRTGTPAADFEDQISPEEKSRRAHRMEEIEKKMRRDYLKASSGKTGLILIEQRENDGSYSGYTMHYQPVKFIPEPERASYSNKIVKADLVYEGGDTLIAYGARLKNL